jgi:hypothetical protein
MKIDNNYPEPVKEVCNDVITELREQNFFEENEADEKITFDFLCKTLLPKFLNGEELLWTDKEMDEYLRRCIVDSVIKSLENKGMVNTIEDENGETVVFMTKEQKENVEERLKDSSPENIDSSK